MWVWQAAGYLPNKFSSGLREDYERCAKQDYFLVKNNHFFVCFVLDHSQCATNNKLCGFKLLELSGNLDVFFLLTQRRSTTSGSVAVWFGLFPSVLSQLLSSALWIIWVNSTCGWKCDSRCIPQESGRCLLFMFLLRSECYFLWHWNEAV